MKLVYEHDDGVVSEAELLTWEGSACGDEAWPLSPGHRWVYRSADSRSEAVLLDRLWVATQEGRVTCLAGYTVTEIRTEAG